MSSPHATHPLPAPRFAATRAGLPPRRCLALFVLIHVVIWTAAPAALNLNAPLDVVEAVGWGHEWQWGYYKHPPLAAWLAELAFVPFAPALWPLYLLSQLCVAATFWAVWRLAREFIREEQALLAVLLLEGCAYFTLTSPQFNPNVLQLPLWAAVMLFAWRALRHGQWHAWLFLGLACGLVLLAKYFAALLLACVCGVLLHTPEGRRTFRTAGPYLALAAGALVFLPHVLWLFREGFPTVNYALERAGASTKWSTRLISPPRFLLAQMLAAAPAMLLAGMLRTAKHRRAASSGRLEDRFLLWMGAGPLAVAMLLSLLFGWRLRSMWGAPLLVSMGLLLVWFFGLELNRERTRRFFIALTTVAALFVAGYLVPLTIGPRFSAKPKRELFPGDALARSITEQWSRRFGTPLRYVIGDTWLASNVHFYSPHHPSVFTHGEPAHAPYVDPQEFRRAGGVIVWLAENGSQMAEPFALRFPAAEIQPELSLPYRRGSYFPVRVGWAIVSPQTP